jgi:hypothetical protein
MNRFKPEYRMQPTKELRANIIRSKLLPNLFNYWVQQGTAPQTDEEILSQLKVILVFIHTVCQIY